jgi:aspartyl/glutamyl-tRNA(Asn/Gln) amidotransferase C subunit
MSTHITSQEIEQLSNLAKLQLTEADEQSLAHDLEGILKYVDSLQAVKVDGVKLDPRVRLLAELRPDTAHPSGLELKELLPTERLADQLLQTPNVFTKHESTGTDNT